ncbi:Uncharacterised protein [Mycobacteroides abscessus subsp. abscessus]|nr:Uncharacterised protein [Mycobacteroides abscessus subsp. abscessus]
MYACPNSWRHSDTIQPANTKTNTPPRANGSVESPPSQANTAPATVSATSARKTELGRTDCFTFTARSYRTSNQLC